MLSSSLTNRDWMIGVLIHSNTAVYYSTANSQITVSTQHCWQKYINFIRLRKRKSNLLNSLTPTKRLNMKSGGKIYRKQSQNWRSSTIASYILMKLYSHQKLYRDWRIVLLERMLEFRKKLQTRHAMRSYWRCHKRKILSTARFLRNLSTKRNLLNTWYSWDRKILLNELHYSWITSECTRPIQSKTKWNNSRSKACIMFHINQIWTHAKDATKYWSTITSNESLIYS